VLLQQPLPGRLVPLRSRFLVMVTAAAVAWLPLAGRPPATHGAPGPRAKAAADGSNRKSKERLARAHFERAEKAFNLGLFHDALSGYHAAYEALPLPAFLFNIAQCHRNAGDSEQAVFFYQRYLSLEPEASNRAVVEELIAEQRHKLADARAAAGASPSDRATSPPATLASPTLAAAANPQRPAAGLDRPADLTTNAGAPSPRVYQRWWFWAAVGGAAVLATTALLLTRPSPPTGALGTIDGR
jgi:hypothetical protein